MLSSSPLSKLLREKLCSWKVEKERERTWRNVWNENLNEQIYVRVKIESNREIFSRQLKHHK